MENFIIGYLQHIVTQDINKNPEQYTDGMSATEDIRLTTLALEGQDIQYTDYQVKITLEVTPVKANKE